MTLPPAGDRGQRYEVTFVDPECGNRRRTFGWASSIEGTQRFVNAIMAHPTWESPEVIDRHAGRDDVP